MNPLPKVLGRREQPVGNRKYPGACPGDGYFLPVCDRRLPVEFSLPVARTDRKWNRGALKVSVVVEEPFPKDSDRGTRSLHPLAVFSAVSPPGKENSLHQTPWRNGRKSIDATVRCRRPRRTAHRVGAPSAQGIQGRKLTEGRRISVNIT